MYFFPIWCKVFWVGIYLIIVLPCFNESFVSQLSAQILLLLLLLCYVLDTGEMHYEAGVWGSSLSAWKIHRSQVHNSLSLSVFVFLCVFMSVCLSVYVCMHVSRECKAGVYFSNPGLWFWGLPNPGTRVLGFGGWVPGRQSVITIVSAYS